MASVADATIKKATRVVARQIANQSNDANVGSSQTSSKNTNSASSIVTTLVPVAAVAAIWLVAFLVLRRIFPRKYYPRSFLGSLRTNERSPTLSKTLFGWIGGFYNIPDTYVLNHHSLDGFLFLRLLKISVIICLVGCCITFPVLFPINATGGNGMKQLDILTFSNVANKWKHFATAGCAWIFFGFVIYMITRESIFYINLRQAYLLSPYYASRLSSRTVLFTSVPEDYQNEAKIRSMLGDSVRRVWVATDCKDLEDDVKDRDKVAMKLEAAETKLIRAANGTRLKAEKKNGGRRTSEAEEAAIGHNGESGSVAARYLDRKKRPTHRLKPLIGKKVDTIDWCRAELQRLIPKVDQAQAKHRSLDVKKVGAVFVEFDTLNAAQSAYQSLTHHQVLHMAPRYTGMNPSEIIWSNLRIKWWERVVRQILTTSFVVALIIFWSIPVAVIGAISNVNYLTNRLPWLDFIYNLPSFLLGLITGLLPVVLLAALMSLLPIILRLMAKLGGDPTRSAVELTVQNSYFGFQVVQVFLVATIGSAASSAVTQIIQNPSSAPSLLATQIPKASNFYLSYFILQGLGVVSSMLVGITGLVVFIILGKLLDKTPRKMYKRWINLAGVGWGTVFPVYTNLLVIAICYSCIAPLVLLFAAIGLYFFYLAYRYNLLFVNNANINTGGRVYPRALQQLFVGLYVAEVCLIGLFAIATASSIGALGPLIMMIIFLIFTVLYHASLNAALDPLINYLPKSLEAEERHLMDAEKAEEGELNGREKGTGHALGDKLGPAPHKKPNLFTKWLRPDIYCDYATMRRLVPKDIAIRYEPEVEENAYYNPAITSQTPLLWIPRDPVGVSRQEVDDTQKVIPITDEGAFLDEKNKIVWDAEDGRPPIYQEPVYY